MKAIRYPFILDTFGKIVSTEDSNKIYTDRVLSLLSTLVFNRPLDAEYGVDLTRALYENANEFDRAIVEAIIRALSKYMPKVKIEKVRVVPPNSLGEASLDIQLSYPDGTTEALSLSASTFANDGTILGDIY